MSNENVVEENKRVSLVKESIIDLTSALALKVDPNEFYSIMEASCFGGKKPTHAQMAAFIVMAKQYNLNPLIKEIYAFPANGSITPIISIDGWIKIAQSNPNFNGITQELIMDDKNNVIAVKCTVSRKDFAFPTVATEFMSENNTKRGVWATRPIRMLKHRATIQAIRLAFGVNAMEESEYNDMNYSQPNKSGAVQADNDLIDRLEASAKNGVNSFKAEFAKLSKQEQQSVGGAKYAEIMEEANNAEESIIDA